MSTVLIILILALYSRLARGVLVYYNWKYFLEFYFLLFPRSQGILECQGNISPPSCKSNKANEAVGEGAIILHDISP